MFPTDFDVVGCRQLGVARNTSLSVARAAPSEGRPVTFCALKNFNYNPQSYLDPSFHDIDPRATPATAHGRTIRL